MSKSKKVTEGHSLVNSELHGIELSKICHLRSPTL